MPPERVAAARTDRAPAPEATEHERRGLAYRPALEGLRAVAVLAVFGYHLGYRQLRGGFLGVDVFFVLSGFLITSAAPPRTRPHRTDLALVATSREHLAVDRLRLAHDAIPRKGPRPSMRRRPLPSAEVPVE